MSTETKKFTKKDVEWLKITRAWGYHKLADTLCDDLKEAEESDE